MEAETCKRELTLEIPAEAVRQEMDRVTAQYQRVARIPGFRRGHARPSLVRQHFRNDIRAEVVQTLVPKFFDSLVREQKLPVVGEPRFENLKFEDDQPLTCKATFEVLPGFELKEYKGLEIEPEPATVTEADIDQALEEMRQRAATFEVVEDRPAADDDYAYASYHGQDINDPGAKPVEVREAMVHLGGKGVVAAFTENLRGVKPGEVREFDVPYPADFPQKSLAGKAYRYRVEVQSIKKKVVAPLDDELAKTVSERGTLAELKEQVRQDLEKRRQRQAENTTKRKLLERLMEAHPFAPPETLVEAQLDRKLENMVAQLLGQGIDPRSTEVDWRKVREEARPDAEKEVRGSLILSRIADAENIAVTEEEVDEMIREVATERAEPPAALKTRLTREGGLDRMKSTRRNQKTLERIYRNAKIIRKSE